MRLCIQNTAALTIVLTMALMLSACAAEYDSGREYRGEDPNSAGEEPLPGSADPDNRPTANEIEVDANPPISEARIGNALSDKGFMSIDERETGLGPDGPDIGHWFIYFSSSTFEWVYSDVSESGTYTLDGNQVVGQSTDRRIVGEYDPDRGVLTWDGTDYSALEAPE